MAAGFEAFVVLGLPRAWAAAASATSYTACLQWWHRRVSPFPPPPPRNCTFLFFSGCGVRERERERFRMECGTERDRPRWREPARWTHPPRRPQRGWEGSRARVTKCSAVALRLALCALWGRLPGRWVLEPIFFGFSIYSRVPVH